MKRKTNFKGKHSRCIQIQTKHPGNEKQNCLRAKEVRLTAGGWAA